MVTCYLKRSALSLVIIVVVLSLTACGGTSNEPAATPRDTGETTQVAGWGPEREMFTMDNLPDYAVFNSLSDNPDLGNERNFVRIRAVGDEYYRDKVTLEVGNTYEVYVYYHNIGVGIADDVRMSANFPATVKKGETLTVNAIISAADTNPLSVWDGTTVTANEDVTLRYVPGSALIHNGGELDGQAIGPDYLFSDDGALLGYNEFSGLLPGGFEYAGYVTFQFIVE